MLKMCAQCVNFVLALTSCLLFVLPTLTAAQGLVNKAQQQPHTHTHACMPA